MRRCFQRFIRKSDGTVTVEWVTLTAAVIGMGMVVLWPVAFSTDSSTRDLADYITEVPVGDNR